LANGGGYYSAFAYVSECRRMGIEVLPPDVNESALSWSGRSATGGRAEPGAGARGRVRAGLGEIRGLREETAKAIVAGRARGGPYVSLDDLLRLAAIDPADARRLVRVGALDGAGLGTRHAARGHAARPLLHWRIQEWEARGEGRRRGGTRPLFAPEPGSLPEPRPHDTAKLLRDEEEALGMLLSRHPLTLYRDALLRLRGAGTILVRGADIARHVGERVAMIGWLITGKIVTTRDDEPMEFVSFEDTTAIYETTFFPRPYARFCRMLNAARPYLLRGRVEEDFGAVTLTVEEVGFLDRAASISRGAEGAAPAAARPGSDRRPSAGSSATPRASSDPPA
jgi:error-prone DNA polymerase